MTRELEIKFAQENRFQRIGKGTIPVDVPLTDQERIEYGAHLTHHVCEIRKLEGELKEAQKKIKTDIKHNKEIVSEVSKILNSGTKSVHKELPIFLDSQNGMKHWVDIETGEIVKSAQADEADFQGSLLDS